MTRASHRTVDLATALVGGMRSEGYEALVAAQLNECIGGNFTIFVDRSEISLGAPDDISTVPWEEIHRECGSGHPLERAYAIDRHTQPLTISDVAEESAWRRNPSYHLTKRHLDGSTKQLAIPLPSPPGLTTGFLICRSRDFTPRERQLANRVHPLIDAVFRHVAEVRRLERRVREAAHGETPPELNNLGLTPRELTVLSLSAEGLTAATVARRLGISPHTVNKHLENAYRKCGTRDRLSTVLLARDRGLIPRHPRHGLNS